MALVQMSRLVVLAVPFFAALLTTLLMVPPVMRLAISKHWLDEPDGVRRGHARPVPRLGGVGIFAGVLLAFGVAPLVGVLFNAAPAVPHLTSAGALIVASAILFLIGLCDDLRGLPPLAKLAGQTLAALVVVYAGFRIDVLIFPPAYQLSLGWLAIPVTIVWLVGVSNALNLVDGLDGLAGGVGVIALLTATVAAVAVGNDDRTLVHARVRRRAPRLPPYNFPPANIFLGDSGSLVVGFLLAVLTVKGATRPDQSTYALAPIFALSFPLLDTGIAMMRRWLRGTPLSRADARHIHHQLRALGLSPRKAVILIYVESAVVAVLGLCVTFAPPEFTVAVAVAGRGDPASSSWCTASAGSSTTSSSRRARPFTSAARQARWVIQDKINARDLAIAIRKADSSTSCRRSSKKPRRTFRFSHMELRHGALARHLPPHIAGELHTARFCKLEYPIAQRIAKPNDFVTLNIWCTTERSEGPSARSVSRVSSVRPSLAGSRPADCQQLYRRQS